MTAATAHENPVTGETVILVFHQALWFGSSMQNSLICPNQVRSHGISWCDDPHDPHREIGLVDQSGEVTIPFDVQGTMVGVTTRVPTSDELQHCRRIEMTSDAPWDPNSSTLPHNQKSNQRPDRRTIQSMRTSKDSPFVDDAFDDCLTSCSPVFGSELLPRLISAVRVGELVNGDPEISVITSKERHAKIGADDLARRWGIGLETARQTLKVTTQHGIRHAVHPLSRRYKTDIILHGDRRRIGGSWHADTLFSSHGSLTSDTCAEVFTNSKLVSVHPMKSKADAGFALDTFTADIGVPDLMIADGAKEQTGPNTEFQRTVRRLHMRFRETEPHSPWQNRAEDAIRNLKRKW